MQPSWKPQVRVAWEHFSSHTITVTTGRPFSTTHPAVTSPSPMSLWSFRGSDPCQRDPFCSPKPQVRPSLVCVLHTSRGTYPRHILHEDSESLLSAVPQTAIVLHNALVLQVFQQLDLTLQSTHLLGERPVFTSALRALVCLPGISSACPSQCPQRGLSALGTSAGETGDSLNCLAVGLNAGQPFECWHSNTGNRKIVGWEKDLWVLGNCCTSGN